MSLERNLTPAGVWLKRRWVRVLARMGLMLRSDAYRMYDDVRPIKPVFRIHMADAPLIRMVRCDRHGNNSFREYSLTTQSVCFRLHEPWQDRPLGERAIDRALQACAYALAVQLLEAAQPDPRCP